MKTPPALRYFGGKHRDAHRIIAQFPDHEFYVEPFGGGASVLLQKNPSKFEVYNDLSGDVVNFFKVLRDRPDELIRAIELTPYSRQEWEESFNPSEDALESARKLYVRSWQTHGGGVSSSKNGGWRFLYRQVCGENVVQCFNRTEHLWILAKRLKQVQIECDPAVAVIQRYGRNPQSLIYCDPPYVHSTRVTSDNYDYEMSDAEHQELAEVLNSVDAMCLVSGYDCELYRQLYKGWEVIEWSTLINSARTAKECLWISPRCSKNQMPLFAAIAGGQA